MVRAQAPDKDAPSENTPSKEASSQESIGDVESEYAKAKAKFQKALADNPTGAKRRQIEEDMRQEQASFSKRFRAIANAGDRKTAVAALSWIVKNDYRDSPTAQAALVRLSGDFVDDDALVDVSRQIVGWMPSVAAETFFTEAAQSSNKAVRGNAVYWHAMYLKSKADLVRILRDPKQASRHAAAETAFGKDAVTLLKLFDPAKIDVKYQTLLEQASEFSDVPSFRGTIADVAKSELFELRNLEVGKPAPEIAGVDLSGKELKLSDYRGKIVVLSFWGSWCPKCMQLVEQERALSETLSDRPFALLGIDSDATQSAGQRAAEAKKMDWPSWWDGDKATGRIATTWNIKEWPVFYVLDHEGVIRAKTTGATPGGLTDVVAPTIDALLAEMGEAGVGKVPNSRWTWLFVAGGLMCLAAVAIRFYLNRTPQATRM